MIPSALAETRETQAGLLLADRFRLMGMVGEGGMGTVFRAYDTELEELIALKLLRRAVLDSPSALARFRQEVKLARRVAHPAVARIFDLGRHGEDHFLTMEFVDGESLAARIQREGALELGCALGIARAILGALEAIHAAGVIHRDLKPDNVLIDGSGRVVVTDFGIARPIEDADRLAQTHGGIIGTPRYMAPEQFSDGAGVDGRADLFALGVLLFEMLSDAPPWEGKTPLALLMARASQPPRDLSSLRPQLPAGIVALVHRLLAIRPEDRPRDAAEIRAALGVQASGAVPPRPLVGPVPVERRKTIAVLPLQATPELAHLAEGVVEALTDGLSMTVGLRVVAQARAWLEADRTADPARLGQSLGAQVLVGGRLTASEGGYLLRVRLTAAHDGIQFWARRFDGPFESLLDLAEQATRAVAEALVVSAPSKRAPSLVDAEALDLYLRGRQAYRAHWAPAVQRAAELMTAARQRAPDHPLIAGGLALARARLVVLGDPAGTDGPAVIRLADEALAALPGNAQAHLAKATLALNGGDLEAAGRGVAEALRAAPGDPEALELAGRLRGDVGPLPAALVLLDTAERLHPGQPATRVHRARVRALLGDFDGALRDLADDSDDEDRRAYLDVTRVRLLGWRKDVAGIRALLAERAAHGLPDVPLLRLSAQAVTEGRLDAEAVVALRALVDLRTGSGRSGAGPRLRAFFHQIQAELHASVGAHDLALEAVEAADRLGLFDVTWIEGCPPLGALRGLPRFQVAAQRVAARASQVRLAFDQV